jgi:hypothetical protein
MKSFYADGQGKSIENKVRIFFKTYKLKWGVCWAHGTHQPSVWWRGCKRGYKRQYKRGCKRGSFWMLKWYFRVFRYSKIFTR